MINQTPLNNIDDQNQNKFQDNDLFKLKFQEIDQNQQFYINNQQNQLLQLESSNTANFGEDFTFSRQSDYDQYYYGSNGNQEKLQKNQQQEDLEVSAFDDGNNHLNLMIDQCKNENTQQKDSVCEEQVYEKKMFEKKYDQSRQLKLNQILKQNGSNQCQQDFNVQNQSKQGQIDLFFSNTINSNQNQIDKHVQQSVQQTEFFTIIDEDEQITLLKTFIKKTTQKELNSESKRRFQRKTILTYFELNNKQILDLLEYYQNVGHTQPFTFDQVQSQELIDKIQKLSNNTVISEYYFNSKKVLQNLKRSCTQALNNIFTQKGGLTKRQSKSVLKNTKMIRIKMEQDSDEDLGDMSNQYSKRSCVEQKSKSARIDKTRKIHEQSNNNMSIQSQSKVTTKSQNSRKSQKDRNLNFQENMLPLRSYQKSYQNYDQHSHLLNQSDFDESNQNSFNKYNTRQKSQQQSYFTSSKSHKNQKDNLLSKRVSFSDNIHYQNCNNSTSKSKFERNTERRKRDAKFEDKITQNHQQQSKYHKQFKCNTSQIDGFKKVEERFKVDLKVICQQNKQTLIQNTDFESKFNFDYFSLIEGFIQHIKKLEIKQLIKLQRIYE